MAQRPNDRVPDSPQDEPVSEPKVFFIVDGKTFGRPALETYYARTPETPLSDATSPCSCNTVSGTYCSCNKVCSCNLVCTCQAACSCVGHRSSTTFCSCNKVCTCVPVH